jgi:transcriptional regulator with XRE-family HTH domain
MIFATIFAVVIAVKIFAKQNQRSEFASRLQEELVRTGRQASPAALAREINLYLRPSERIHPSSCRKWLKAEAIPTQEKLLILARILQVTPSFLRYGQMTELREPEPDQQPFSTEELALVDLWRQLEASQRRAVRLMMSQFIKKST